MNQDSTLVSVIGHPSWRVTSDRVEAYVTELGGEVGPVTFDLDGQKIMPYAVAPWSEEDVPANISPHLKPLRGDFFCMPFGTNTRPFNGEEHPSPHGQTANGIWSYEDARSGGGRHLLHISQQTIARAGRVDKRIMLRDGHPAVYSQHVISGMDGPMNLGHHAMLEFPDEPGCGIVSTSPFVRGMAVPRSPEALANPNRTFALMPGAEFDSLERVPGAAGEAVDISRYPARRGYGDNALVVSDTSLPFAWTAVTFPAHGYVWFALKDPRVLRTTMFWLSNGAGKSAPWNGRHINVMGLEEITSFFDKGLAASVEPNALSEGGCPTYVELSADRPFVINYIMAAAAIPAGFDRVVEITARDGEDAVRVRSSAGPCIDVRLDAGFLRTPAIV